MAGTSAAGGPTAAHSFATAGTCCGGRLGLLARGALHPPRSLPGPPPCCMRCTVLLPCAHMCCSECLSDPRHQPWGMMPSSPVPARRLQRQRGQGGTVGHSGAQWGTVGHSGARWGTGWRGGWLQPRLACGAGFSAQPHQKPSQASIQGPAHVLWRVARAPHSAAQQGPAHRRAAQPGTGPAPGTHRLSMAGQRRCSGRRPVSAALPERCRLRSMGSAPSSSHAGGKAGPDREFAIKSSVTTCGAVGHARVGRTGKCSQGGGAGPDREFACHQIPARPPACVEHACCTAMGCCIVMGWCIVMGCCSVT